MILKTVILKRRKFLVKNVQEITNTNRYYRDSDKKFSVFKSQISIEKIVVFFKNKKQNFCRIDGKKWTRLRR